MDRERRTRGRPIAQLAQEGWAGCLETQPNGPQEVASSVPRTRPNAVPSEIGALDPPRPRPTREAPRTREGRPPSAWGQASWQSSFRCP